MSQHDYVLDNQAGSLFRADLNSNMAAIVSMNSGASAPSTTYAYMFWADTTSGYMKQRNSANTAWITLFKLADGGGISNPITSFSGVASMTLADYGKLMRATAVSTLGLANVASLSNGWYFAYRAEGGTLTLDPASSQTINGAATYALTAGASGIAVCDGTGWYTIDGFVTLPTTTTNLVVTGSLTSANLRVTSVANFTGITLGTYNWFNTQIFTTPGTSTYTKSQSVSVIEYEVCGPGGGGGSISAAAATKAAGGGGAGGYVTGRIAAASLSATVTVVIGTGGAGGTAGSDGTGPASGTAFGSYVICNQGNGGGGSVSGGGAGGNGGSVASALGGVLSVAGQNGQPGTSNAVYGGDGGNSFLGFGGRGNRNTSGGGGNANQGYGAGGGGASGSTAVAQDGGDGSGGYVIIREFR